jgi:hypothetical protein
LGPSATSGALDFHSVDNDTEQRRSAAGQTADETLTGELSAL